MRIKRITREQLAEAAERYADFHNETPEYVELTNISSPVAFLLGDVVSIAYRLVENGRETVYNHDFETPPGLAISHDGETAFILPGEWTFTKRGFEG